jgi:threonine/homoserine/homoserine lactone efflux protein
LPKPRANAWRAFRSGFVTNLFNPKATLFFLALFTQAIDPQTPIVIQFVYGCVCAVTAGTWFTIVSMILTKDKLRHVFSGYSLWIDRICGLAFIAVALRLAFVKAP